MARAVTTLLTLLLASSHAAAQGFLPKALEPVGFDQKLDAQVPLELEFRDETGATVALGSLWHERPVILVLAYYRCPMLCSQVLNGLVQALLDIPLDAGKDFDVIAVSFDPREQPELAAAKKKAYLERYGRPGAAAGWHFLTGEPDMIEKLTHAVGFRYAYDAEHDQFAHASGILLLTPAGKVSRYFYDIRYSARDLRLGLVDASAGHIGSPVDQVLLYCFHYDPATGKYGPSILNLVRLGGVLTMIGVATLFVVLWRRERRAVAPGPAR
jgi:protein SCO1/2